MWIPIVSIKRHTAYSFKKSLVQHFSVLQWVRVQIGRFDRKIQKKPREESSLRVHPKSHCFWMTLPLEVSDGACLKCFLGDDGISMMSDAHTHWKHTDGYNAKKFCVGLRTRPWRVHMVSILSSSVNRDRFPQQSWYLRRKSLSSRAVRVLEGHTL